MPILTPAYPSMNSSFNVSTHSLAVMKEEFKRALGLVQDILNKGATDWAPLFDPSDFFAVHQHYLAVEVYTTKEDEEQAWCGFCESRIRKLVEGLAYNPPLCHLQAFPKKFPLSFVENQSAASPTDAGSDAKANKYGVCFFVGFDINRRLLHSREVSIDNSVEYFKHNDLYRWNKRTTSMDVKITPVVWKGLPDCVFEEMGGRSVARDARREFMKKKKEEEKAAAAAASGQEAGSGDDDLSKGSLSQDTDGAGDDASSAAEDAPGAETSVECATAPSSPNPAGEGGELSKEDQTTPVKPKKPTQPTDTIGKRERADTKMSELSVEEKSATSNGTASGPPTPSSAVKVAKEVSSQRASAPAPISSPRKRRKMKISFGKLS